MLDGIPLPPLPGTPAAPPGTALHSGNHPAGDGRDAQGALAARLTTEVARPSGRLHVVGHSFGGQVALDFALLVPQQVATLTLLCSRDTPFPAFAAAAARLRGGAPVDADAALSRWFTPAELDRGAPVVMLRAPLPAASGPPVVGGCAGCHRPLRPGRPHRLHPDPGHAHRSRTRPGVHSGRHVSPGQPPAQGHPADPARRRAHDTLHRSSRPGRAHPPRRQAMIAGFPATPLALPNPPCPIPDSREPRTRSLAVLSSREPGHPRATSGMRVRESRIFKGAWLPWSGWSSVNGRPGMGAKLAGCHRVPQLSYRYPARKEVAGLYPWLSRTVHSQLTRTRCSARSGSVASPLMLSFRTGCPGLIAACRRL